MKNMQNLSLSKRGDIYDVIIVGGGASGLMCAASFYCEDGSEQSLKVKGLILEKTERLGSKLLLSGGGRCNLTHGGNIKDFISCYGEAGSKIRKLLYKYSNEDLKSFFEGKGMPLMEEDDGRVFPKSENGKDVLNLLRGEARKNGFEIKNGEGVLAIEKEDGFWRLVTEENNFSSKNIVIATGGASYPKTGSDGKFYETMERDLSLEIVEPKPGLHPIRVKDYPYKELAGITVNAELRLGKKKMRGNLLFTHDGFSGPVAINLSSYVGEGDRISINYLVEGDDPSGLPKRFIKKIEERGSGSTKKTEKLLTEDTFIIADNGRFSEAMITRGGVSLTEIDLKTMEVKEGDALRPSGLYIIGEVLDVDGETGGYNLQFAYSSARAAASGIAARLATPD